MVSTASRVGTGNIVGVANAIALGGYGAVFWMWVIAIIGGSSEFIESTLAQVYKKKANDGSSYGGPSYYIEAALKVLDDYVAQRKAGKDPQFKAANVGITGTDFWN